jgi:hypothetical protein
MSVDRVLEAKHLMQEIQTIKRILADGQVKVHSETVALPVEVRDKLETRLAALKTMLRDKITAFVTATET